MRNKKTAVERPAVKYLKYELAQRPIIDKLQLHYQKYGCGVLSFGVQSNSMPRHSLTPKLQREICFIGLKSLKLELTQKILCLK